MKQTEIEVIEGGAFLGSFFGRPKNERKDHLIFSIFLATFPVQVSTALNAA
jgi:hypothetical protein